MESVGDAGAREKGGSALHRPGGSHHSGGRGSGGGTPGYSSGFFSPGGSGQENRLRAPRNGCPFVRGIPPPRDLHSPSRGERQRRRPDHGGGLLVILAAELGWPTGLAQDDPSPTGDIGVDCGRGSASRR